MNIIIITIKNSMNKTNTHINKYVWGIDSTNNFNEFKNELDEDFWEIVEGNELFKFDKKLLFKLELTFASLLLS